MNRLVLLLVLIIWVYGTLFAQDPPPVDGFQFPSSGSWNVNCNDFWGTCNNPDKWHTGEDVPASAGTPVFAPADGIVKHTMQRTSYGNVVIIEHNVSDGYVCSINGHLRSSGLQVSVGQVVNRGDLLGYLGTIAENGGWIPHFHFGINKGRYKGDYYPGCSTGSWWYSGYTSCATDKDLWHDPSVYVAAHPYPGVYADGWHSDGTSQAILNRFNAENGKLGAPFDNRGTAFVHTWYGVRLQDCKKDDVPRYGSDGQTALALNNAGTAAHLLKEGFWCWLKYNQMKIGPPESEEYLDTNPSSPHYNKWRQNFGEEVLVWSGNPGDCNEVIGVHPKTVGGALIATHEVTFTSSPSSADLYSGDAKVGVTPLTVSLLEGEMFTYTAKMLGYQDVSQTFTVTSDMTVSFTLAGTGLTNPYGLHMVDCTTNQMTIAWNDNNAPSSMVYYKIYRNGSYFTSTSMGQKSYIDYGLSSNTSYQYFVTAVKQGMESGPSETITETTLHEPTDFPVRLVARLSSDFPTRYEVDDHPEGGVGFHNTTGYIVSKDITFPQAGQYQYTVEAKCAYAGSPVMRVESQLYNTPVNIYEVVNSTSWTRFSVNFNVSGAGLVTQAKVKAVGNVSDGYPLCVDSVIVVYLGPLPPVLAVDSTALHFGSVDTLRSFHITNTGGPGLNWACSYSNEATYPIPAQGGAPATVDAYLHRAEREPGSYVDTLWVTSNGGNRTILCYYTVPDPNLLLNGGFESGISPWVFQNWPDRATATVTGNGGEFTEGVQGLRVNITSIGEPWVVAVRQVVSVTSQTYTLSFKAKAASQRTILVWCGEEGTWVNLGLWVEPVISTNWNTYTYEFTPGQSSAQARIQLDLGAHSATFWLDGVRLESAAPPQPPALSLNPTVINLDSTQNAGTFVVGNSGGGTLNWSATESSAALSLSLASGSAPASDTVTVNLARSQAAVGAHADTVLVGSNGGNGSVIVQYVILPPLNNLLTNGGFESGFSPWVFQNWPDRGTATVTSNGGEFTEGTHGLRVNITNPGEFWMIHVRQKATLSSQAYTLSFKAKAASQRTLIARCYEDNTWTYLGLWQEPVLTTNWQPFSYTFTPGQATSNALIGLDMGASNITVWLDDVKLVAGLGKAAPGALEESLPASYALYQNHPNPFNPTTTFRFDLPEQTHVRLTVHNIIGQRKVAVIDGVMDAGAHSIVWDASQLPSGVYFYTLEAGSFLATKKLVLLK